MANTKLLNLAVGGGFDETKWRNTQILSFSSQQGQRWRLQEAESLQLRTEDKEEMTMIYVGSTAQPGSSRVKQQEWL